MAATAIDDYVKFRDRRGREWEMFYDESYYDMYCVKQITVTPLSPPLKFYYASRKDAELLRAQIEKSM